MRTSAHTIKKRGQGASIRSEPQEGTRLRKYFDLAMTGDWFDLQHLPPNIRGGILPQLRISYELEFIHRSHSTDTPPYRSFRQYKCIGRWIGADLRSLEDVEVALNHTQKG